MARATNTLSEPCPDTAHAARVIGRCPQCGYFVRAAGVPVASVFLRLPRDLKQELLALAAARTTTLNRLCWDLLEVALPRETELTPPPHQEGTDAHEDEG